MVFVNSCDCLDASEHVFACSNLRGLFAARLTIKNTSMGLTAARGFFKS